jgi:hypothetical protein
MDAHFIGIWIEGSCCHELARRSLGPKGKLGEVSLPHSIDVVPPRGFVIVAKCLTRDLTNPFSYPSKSGERRRLNFTSLP